MTPQPVKAWKYKILLVICGPIAESNSWTGIHRALAPCQKSINMLRRPWCCRDGSTDTAMMTTSMPLAFMMRDLQLPCVASHACTNILVSASSWLHGATASSDIILLLMVSSFVTTTMLAVSASHSLSSITWNSSVLLFSSCKKLLQFVGALLVSVTLLLILGPLFWVTSNQVELLVDEKYYVNTLIFGTTGILWNNLWYVFSGIVIKCFWASWRYGID